MSKKSVRERRRAVSVLIAVYLGLGVVASTFITHAAAQGVQSNTITRGQTVAAVGYYFEVSPCPRCYRCRPCTLSAGWQQRVMRRLDARRLGSFAGEASGLSSAQDVFGTVTAIKRLRTPHNYNTMVYVGPFDSDAAALAAISDLCSVLSEIGEMESTCDEMVAKRDGSTFYTRGSFDVSGVRVSPKAASNN